MIPFGQHASVGTPRLLSRNDLIFIILKLQFEGWQVALADPELTPDVDEPYMNGRLFQGMVTVRERLNLTNIFIVETPGVRVATEPALPQAEPDVILLFAEFGANEPHAIIECKRLNPFENPKNLRGEYIRSGVDRFIKGTYGAGHDLDFMVAFVLQSDGPAAMADVNEYLTNVTRRHDHLRACTKFLTGGFVAESDHKRADATSVRLLHSYMLFPNQPTGSHSTTFSVPTGQQH